MGTECEIILTCRAIAYVRIHGTIKRTDGEVAHNDKYGVYCRGKAMWECTFDGHSEDCILGDASCGVWMVSLQKFGELLCEGDCRGVRYMLNVEPIISFGG